jgi:hypothetical protein
VYSFIAQLLKLKIIVPVEFYGDETPLSFYETLSFSLLAISSKLMM